MPQSCGTAAADSNHRGTTPDVISETYITRNCAGPHRCSNHNGPHRDVYSDSSSDMDDQQQSDRRGGGPSGSSWLACFSCIRANDVSEEQSFLQQSNHISGNVQMANWHGDWSEKAHRSPITGKLTKHGRRSRRGNHDLDDEQYKQEEDLVLQQEQEELEHEEHLRRLEEERMLLEEEELYEVIREEHAEEEEKLEHVELLQEERDTQRKVKAFQRQKRWSGHFVPREEHAVRARDLNEYVTSPGDCSRWSTSDREARDVYVRAQQYNHLHGDLPGWQRPDDPLYANARGLSMEYNHGGGAPEDYRAEWQMLTTPPDRDHLYYHQSRLSEYDSYYQPASEVDGSISLVRTNHHRDGTHYQNVQHRDRLDYEEHRDHVNYATVSSLRREHEEQERGGEMRGDVVVIVEPDGTHVRSNGGAEEDDRYERGRSMEQEENTDVKEVIDEREQHASGVGVNEETDVKEPLKKGDDPSECKDLCEDENEDVKKVVVESDEEQSGGGKEELEKELDKDDLHNTVDDLVDHSEVNAEDIAQGCGSDDRDNVDEQGETNAAAEAGEKETGQEAESNERNEGTEEEITDVADNEENTTEQTDTDANENEDNTIEQQVNTADEQCVDKEEEQEVENCSDRDHNDEHEDVINDNDNDAGVDREDEETLCVEDYQEIDENEGDVDATSATDDVYEVEPELEQPYEYEEQQEECDYDVDCSDNYASLNDNDFYNDDEEGGMYGDESEAYDCREDEYSHNYGNDSD